MLHFCIPKPGMIKLPGSRCQRACNSGALWVGRSTGRKFAGSFARFGKTWHGRLCGSRHFHLPPDGTHEGGGRTTRQPRHRFALRRPAGGTQRLHRIGITLSRAPPAGALQNAAHSALSRRRFPIDGHAYRHGFRQPRRGTEGVAVGQAKQMPALLVVPRWFLGRFPI
jgi:hypothetical protein